MKEKNLETKIVDMTVIIESLEHIVSVLESYFDYDDNNHVIKKEEYMDYVIEKQKIMRLATTILNTFESINLILEDDNSKYKLVKVS